MIKEIKRLYWDLVDPNERVLYISAFLSFIPSLFGHHLRKTFFSKKFKKAGKNLSVFSGARFRSMEKLEVGDDVQIGHDCFIQALGGVRIGNNVIISPGVKIWSVNHDFNDPDKPINKQPLTKKEVIIEDDVWISSNAFIMPGAKIGRGTVISAGAIVGGKQIKPYSILAGNPARVIGSRLKNVDKKG